MDVSLSRLKRPKYRLRILSGQVAEDVSKCIRVLTDQKGSKVIVLSIQIDHAHLIVLVPPRISI
jgi:putative transposase